MHWFFVGAALSLAVSMPPGANTLLCLSKGRYGARHARPLILAAALADGVYALLAGLGLLAAALAGVSNGLAVASVPFLLFCAWLLWPRHPLPSDRSAALVAAINPPAALLWLALAGTLADRPSGLMAVSLFVAGALLATGLWFTCVAVAAQRFADRLSERTMRRVAVVFCGLLVGLAVVRTVILLT